ncbi:MAG: hypothetical protein ACUVRJ_10810 [Candidatus Villigracilaceae bacterium]
MTSKVEPGKRESLSKVASVEVKAGHPDGPDTVTVEMQLPQSAWENLRGLFVARKWTDVEGLAATVAAGIAILQTEPPTIGEDKIPDQTIRELRTQLADLEAQCEVLRNQVDKLQVLEWRELPLVRQQLGDYKALIMRLTDERDTLQTENAQLRHQLAEAGESKAHP